METSEPSAISSGRITGLATISIFTLMSASGRFWLPSLLGLLSIGAALLGVHRQSGTGGLVRFLNGDQPMMRKWTTRLAGLLGAACILTFVIAVSNTPSAQADAERRSKQRRMEAGDHDLLQRSKLATEQADRIKGIHCLNGWDGSHWDMQDAIKARLRDPSSFEHIETSIGPADGNGRHRVILKFRAANGFGGMNVEQAIGVIDGKDCNLLHLEM